MFALPFESIALRFPQPALDRQQKKCLKKCWGAALRYHKVSGLINKMFEIRKNPLSKLGGMKEWV
jgi:hypothetical protein